MAARSKVSVSADDSVDVLVLNAGSSSLKFALFAATVGGTEPQMVLTGQFAGLGTVPSFEVAGADPTALVPAAPAALPATCSEAAVAVFTLLDRHRPGRPPALVGHRFVHGGPAFSAPTMIDDQVLAALQALVPMAPLHLPASLAVLAAARSGYPGSTHVACFDTAFHAGQPDMATRYALPREIAAKGYRRYGFHGLNYEHVVRQLPILMTAPLPRRLLVFHLGNGASLGAISQGASIATTMGYSTLDGLVMGTRCGSLDPGVLIGLLRNDGFDADALETLLYRESGLKALSGSTSDMRTLVTHAAAGDGDARFAVDAFCYWAARHAGSLITALGGLDAIVFTGGIGERSAAVRAGIAAHLGWCGVALDPAANAAGSSRLSPAGAPVTAWCVSAGEEAMIARHTLRAAGLTVAGGKARRATAATRAQAPRVAPRRSPA
jgi:acetate kinase